MAVNRFGRGGGALVSPDVANLLTSEQRVLAYLRAAMLEFGDSTQLMSIVIRNVQLARANLQRRGPARAELPEASDHRSLYPSTHFRRR